MNNRHFLVAPLKSKNGQSAFTFLAAAAVEYIKASISFEFSISSIREPTARTEEKRKEKRQEKFEKPNQRLHRTGREKYREKMYAVATSTSWFGARTVVAVLAVLAVSLAVLAAEAQQQTSDGCRIECYPNTKVINGKGGVGKSDNCRWILRTDGKPARLCDHIKCRKVCPNNQAASAAVDQQETAASTQQSDNMHIEQQLEGDAAAAAPAPVSGSEPMGIMRQLHGNKLAKAPVPGVAGGRLTNQPQQQQPAQPISASGRRMAPTLPPAVQYDENDTPPPISRFLDISPEE